MGLCFRVVALNFQLKSVLTEDMEHQEQPQEEPTGQRLPETWVLRARQDRLNNGLQEKRGQRDSLKLPEIRV